MLLALLLSLAPTIVQADNGASPPSISVKLNREQFTTGDRARVSLETAQDGYVVVLHADPDGRVRVLFPLDPTDDDFVRGGRRIELRGRSGRDAFLVDTDDGAGTVLAVVKPDPFNYDAFVRNDHWDYRALRGPSVKDDPLAGLLDIVQQMAGDMRFEYDAATYVVTPRQVASRYGYGDGYGYGPYGFRLGLAFGHPSYLGRYTYGRFYDPFYNPFCYDPFWGWSVSCYGYGYGYGFGSGYSFYRPYSYGHGRSFVTGFTGGGGSRFVIPPGRGRYTPLQPRKRSGFGDPLSIRDRLFVQDHRAVSRGFEPRVRDGGKTTIAPRGRDIPRMSEPPTRSSGGRPSVSRGWSGGSRPSGGRPSVSRGWGGGSRPAARPSFGGGRRSGGGGGRRH